MTERRKLADVHIVLNAPREMYTPESAPDVECWIYSGTTGNYILVEQYVDTIRIIEAAKVSDLGRYLGINHTGLMVEISMPKTPVRRTLNNREWDLKPVDMKSSRTFWNHYVKTMNGEPLT
ncbi:hypothetical protein IPM62_04310 [Candidatus Woesebacteria bacterium]|nr:MAG: hypothetical protein IPM62_04310 [Candidatus Woesebacteria bacterium]